MRVGTVWFLMGERGREEREGECKGEWEGRTGREGGRGGRGGGVGVQEKGMEAVYVYGEMEEVKSLAG